VILLCVPRLHDIGRSGWWAGGLIVAEIAVVACALIALPEDSAMLVLGLFAIVVAILLAVLGAMPGQARANRFGGVPAPGLSFGRPAEGPETQF